MIMKTSSTAILKTLSLFATIAVVLCAFYCAANYAFEHIIVPPALDFSSFYGINVSSSPKQLVKDEHYELIKVLKSASTKEKTVILTTLNDAWSAPNSIFDLFLESFRIGNNTSRLLDHLVVIALDSVAYSRCQNLNLVQKHCYFLMSNQSTQMAGQANFMSPIYLDLVWNRLACLHTILTLGYNFLITDTDVMWFRDPFPHFTPDADFQTSCDRFNGRQFDLRNTANNGFVFVRSNNRTKTFYETWVTSRHLYPGSLEQDVYNRIKYELIKQVGLKVRFLDTDYFGGFCGLSRDFNKVCTMHANCCVGLDRKIDDLKTTLEDWKNYMSGYQNATQPYRWRVPIKCHM